MSEHHMMTIYSQEGASSLPYDKCNFTLRRGEEFEPDENGKEEKLDQIIPNKIVKGTTVIILIWAPINGGGTIIGKFKRESHVFGLIKQINQAYDDHEEYFYVPLKKQIAEQNKVVDKATKIIKFREKK